MFKQKIKELLPSQIAGVVRKIRRHYRRLRWELAVRTQDDTYITGDELLKQLRILGVKKDTNLIVHSALSRLGFVEGGAETVVDVLLEAVGPEGTLIMPVYPMKGTMYETMLDKTVFDVATTPSTMGKITEVFRLRPDVLRSAHPTHSVAALGPAAEVYVAKHHLSKSLCGPGSPFRMLSERKGYILCLGSGVGKVTSHHTIEDLVDEYPLKVYLEEPFHKQVKLIDGSEVTVEVLVHDPKLAAVRVDNNLSKEKEILDEMRRRGIVSEGKIGKADAYLFGAADFETMHAERLKQGKTIYAID